jgi:hypothetical protein
MAGSYDLVGRITTLLPALAHLGAAHLIGDSYDTLPPRSRNEARATVSTARSVESYINEYREGAVAMHQAAAVVDFAGKPLIVLTAGRGHDATWQAATEQARHPSVGTARSEVPATGQRVGGVPVERLCRMYVPSGRGVRGLRSQESPSRHGVSRRGQHERSGTRAPSSAEHHQLSLFGARRRPPRHQGAASLNGCDDRGRVASSSSPVQGGEDGRFR